MQNHLVEKSVSFSLLIITYVSKLNDLKVYVIANQLLKSGTSIGANIHEAQFAESRADFLHKLKIAEKETNETTYWLRLCLKHHLIRSPSSDIMNLSEELGRLLRSSILTVKKSTK